MSCRWSKPARFVAVLAFVVLLACLAFAARGPKSNHGRMGLTYEGRTNIIAPFFYGSFNNETLYLTGKFAVFTLQSRSTFYHPKSIELLTAEGWVTDQTFSPDGSWPFNVAETSTKTKLVFWVPIPSTNKLWRIRFTCIEKSSGWGGMKDMATDIRDNLREKFAGQRGGQETFSGRQFEVVSPAVSP